MWNGIYSATVLIDSETCTLGKLVGFEPTTSSSYWNPQSLIMTFLSTLWKPTRAVELCQCSISINIEGEAREIISYTSWNHRVPIYYYVHDCSLTNIVSLILVPQTPHTSLITGGCCVTHHRSPFRLGERSHLNGPESRHNFLVPTYTQRYRYLT